MSNNIKSFINGRTSTHKYDLSDHMDASELINDFYEHASNDNNDAFIDIPDLKIFLESGRVKSLINEEDEVKFLDEYQKFNEGFFSNDEYSSYKNNHRYKLPSGSATKKPDDTNKDGADNKDNPSKSGATRRTVRAPRSFLGRMLGNAGDEVTDFGKAVVHNAFNKLTS